jgi:hypothetical protein
MSKKAFTTATSMLLVTIALGAGAATPPATVQPGAAVALPRLSAEQIVERNVAARGGLAAWHGVHSMIWKGKVGAGATSYPVVTKGHLEIKQRDETLLPYTLEIKRPIKTRLEIQFKGQTAVQVFDGVQGWKLRPYLGRNDWDPYTADEARQAAAEPGVDGFLVDYAAKGAKVDLIGTEKVEDKDAYKLKITMRGGQVRHIWVDGRSFLEVKVQGLPRHLDGKLHDVEIYLRDFRSEGSIVIPHLIETRVVGLRKTEKITIESATVNPKLDDSRFTKQARA